MTHSTKERSNSGISLPIWQEIRDFLETQKNEIYEAIRNYPPPIPGCDAQFNHLLEQRGKILQELTRLHELLAQEPERQEMLQQIESFLQTSDFIDKVTEQRLRSAFSI